MKSREPSSEPWGTPWDRGAMEEEQLLMWLNCRLSVRYDWSLERAVPMMRKEDSRRESRIGGPMVLKAAVRSRRTKMLKQSESVERGMSLVTLRRAVSVRWCE